MLIYILLLVTLMLCQEGDGSIWMGESRLGVLPCGITKMNPGERATVQSPNFPSNYPLNYRCQYELSCNNEDATYLEYVCPNFSLEYSSLCINDRLIVTYHGSREEKCGSDSPNGTITSDGWTRLTFFSNGLKTAQGFRCYIWCKQKSTSGGITTTAPSTC